MLVLKRNNKIAEFDESEIINDVLRAAKVSKSHITKQWIKDNVIAKLQLIESITVNEIGTQVEDLLMKADKCDIARYLIINRHINYHDKSLTAKVNYLNEYFNASNASTGSKYDSNANVSSKNLATFNAELYKSDTIRLNRFRVCSKLEKLYGKKEAEAYMDLLEKHFIYCHDESSINPYCVAGSLYWLINEGTNAIGGHASAPKHLDSFIGQLNDCVFTLGNMFAGAIALPELWVYFDWFARKDFGDDYLTTHTERIDQYISMLIHHLNSPSGRAGQSLFTNDSYFDKYYFQSIFGDFYFPDFSQPKWETVKELQFHFMEWLWNERKSSELTFPVETFSFLTKDGEYLDTECYNRLLDLNVKGHTPFVYQSESVDSLASCCRLRNALEENTFSMSNGAGGIKTGSKNVITINLNRCVQEAIRKGKNYMEFIKDIHKHVIKFQTAHNELIWDLYNMDALTAYKCGFIDLDKQFLTIGINGINEAAEFLGMECSNNDTYKHWASELLKQFSEVNRESRTEHTRFNTEFVPAENLGVKNYKWDKRDGYWVPEDRYLYSSYFFPSESQESVFDKLELHGKTTTQYLDGGSACHINLDKLPSKVAFDKMYRKAAKVGCSYFTFNIVCTRCKKCGKIHYKKMDKCPDCGSTDIDFLTRIIGYWKAVSAWGDVRQKEFFNYRAFNSKLKSKSK